MLCVFSKKLKIVLPFVLLSQIPFSWGGNGPSRPDPGQGGAEMEFNYPTNPHHGGDHYPHPHGGGVGAGMAAREREAYRRHVEKQQQKARESEQRQRQEAKRIADEADQKFKEACKNLPQGFCTPSELARWRENQLHFKPSEFPLIHDVDLKGGVVFDEPQVDLSSIPESQLIPSYPFKSRPSSHLTEMKRMYAQFEHIRPQDSRRLYAKNLGLATLEQADHLTATDFLFEAGVYKEIAKGLLDIAIGANPVSATGRAIYEVFSGHDLINNQELSFSERAFNLATAMSGLKSVSAVSKYVRMAAPTLRKHIPYEKLIRKAERIAENLYNPIKRGKLDHISVDPFHPVEKGGKSVTNTFRSDTYAQKPAKAGEKFYRVQTHEIDPNRGAPQYWTKEKPTGPLQAKIDSVLHPKWKNNAQRVIEMETPGKGETYFHGPAAEVQGSMTKDGFRDGFMQPGKEQIYFEHVDSSWIKDAKGELFK
jgi:hypothetical protein